MKEALLWQVSDRRGWDSMTRMPQVPEGTRSRGQPSPAPAAASCRTGVLEHAMLPRESSAPGLGLDSITIWGSAHSNCFAEPLYNNHISLLLLRWLMGGFDRKPGAVPLFPKPPWQETLFCYFERRPHPAAHAINWITISSNLFHLATN